MIPENIRELSEFELAQLLRPLTAAERNVLKMRLGLGDGVMRTLQEVADNFAIPVKSVMNLEIKALAKLGWVSIAE